MRADPTHHAIQASFGARGFYVGTYFFFYLSVAMYQSLFTDWIKEGDWFNLVFYLACHAVVLYLFFTAGKNPGFVIPGYTKVGQADVELGNLTTESD